MESIVPAFTTSSSKIEKTFALVHQNHFALVKKSNLSRHQSTSCMPEISSEQTQDSFLFSSSSPLSTGHCYGSLAIEILMLKALHDVHLPGGYFLVSGYRRVLLKRLDGLVVIDYHVAPFGGTGRHPLQIILFCSWRG
ncbi:hypothetical protein Dimus_007569 [Dionaea muscipula]